MVLHEDSPRLHGRKLLLQFHVLKKFFTEGAIGSHLENLERKQGFKGFNQDSVSAIIKATDPRKHLKKGA